MNVILETERLILREFDIGDAELLYELNADLEVMKYTGDVAFESVEEAKELVLNYSQYKLNGFGRNSVILKSNKELIGWCGLKKHEDGLVDIGYRFFKKHWNKGYATESSKAIIEFGFKNYGIKQVVGRTSKRNLGSIRVFEKLGMNFWKEEACEGIEDSVHYTIGS